LAAPPTYDSLIKKRPEMKNKNLFVSMLDRLGPDGTITAIGATLAMTMGLVPAFVVGMDSALGFVVAWLIMGGMLFVALTFITNS
jgi:hypothetical protein